jgi:hypothetical protein
VLQSFREVRRWKRIVKLKEGGVSPSGVKFSLHNDDVLPR